MSDHVHDWRPQWGYGCLPGSLRCMWVCCCGASTNDDPEPRIVRSNTSTPTRLADGTFV